VPTGARLKGATLKLDVYKLIRESADRNVTIFVRTNYNSLKEAWQSWQKFGNRAHSGDCNPLIIICLRTFLISRRWCGTKLRNKYSSGPLPKKIQRRRPE
ncbi:hypothetical protein, partial [Phocaeicola coprophilus]|uniref:hypothetical protein n=1 Tax=Phocaeicola coprophilus TaxID=387090 RepID=UPI00266B4A82